MTNVSRLETRSLVNVVDDSGQIVDADFLDGPRPVARVTSRKVAMRHFKVGANIGHVDIVALFEQPESERSFFVDHPGDRVGQDAVLQDDGVTQFLVLAAGQMMSSQDESIFSLDIDIFAFVSEKVGVVFGARRESLAAYPFGPLLLDFGSRRRMRERTSPFKDERCDGDDDEQVEVERRETKRGGLRDHEHDLAEERRGSIVGRVVVMQEVSVFWIVAKFFGMAFFGNEATARGSSGCQSTTAGFLSAFVHVRSSRD